MAHTSALKRTRVLRDLHRMAMALRAFLRAGPGLTDEERLFVENRLMMMQIEYLQYGKQSYKDKRHRAPVFAAPPSKT